MFVFISLMFACELEIDTAQDKKKLTNEDVDLETIEDYVFAYCDVYALPCEVYTAHDECENHLLALFPEDCSIVDTQALEICMNWLSDVSCEEDGWIEECDTAYSCD